jgi:hypothetical protein
LKRIEETDIISTKTPGEKLRDRNGDKTGEKCSVEKVQECTGMLFKVRMPMQLKG